MTDRASTEGLRAALFDCYVLLPPERLDLLRDETKQTIDAAAALRDTGPRPDSGIDVERLARAFDKVWRDDGWEPTAVSRMPAEEAERIAAEYARLSTPRTETSEP